MAYLEVKTGIQKTFTNRKMRGVFSEVDEVYSPFVVVECYTQALFPWRNGRRSAGVLLWGFTEMVVEIDG